MATTPVLKSYSRDPLYGLTREQTVAYISSALAGRCVAAYLYGSFARDEIDSGSDIDCIVVAETELPFTGRSSAFFDLRKRLPSLEILVYTRAEFDNLTGNPTPGFWRSACADMMQIL